MGEKIVVGPIDKGLRTDRTPFVIDNDSFPTLLNAYQWRGRIKRKRGTALLGRLQRFFNSSSTSYSTTSTITFDSSGNANILTGFSLQTNGNIVPGTVTIVGSVGPVTYTDPTEDGYLTPTGTLGPNTINYATGAILIPAQASGTATVTMEYYPDLPVMGLKDFVPPPTLMPQNIAFDTTYAYRILRNYPYSIYDVSFYKNPPIATYVGYTQKSTVTPTSWNGANYQQFWTTSYAGALWATNGITVPFTIANIGMQYKPIVTVTVTSGGPPAIATLQITGHGLVVGDFVFINEVITTTGINYQTGYVISVIDANNVSVEFPNATLSGNGSGGIAQYLTNRSDPTKDCLRWYDGDPTNGNPSSPVLNGNLGWVNFAPPLSNAAFSIDDELAQQYYLVGARVIVPYKDRLLFFGPVIQTSTANSQIYLQDAVIYSQNGTPYYTSSFTGSPTSATTVFNPILTPAGETASPASYFEDITGYGGYISAGSSQPITSASFNEDVLIVGFTNRQSRLVYTGNDIVPFNFFTINSEYGTNSTFSVVTSDRGVWGIGTRGITITAQDASQRMDLDIPDQIFQFNLTNQGTQRVTAQRDFINEWIYFTYCSNQAQFSSHIFPTQTLQYNYREGSWAIFNESYTAYGQFRKQTGLTWSTVGMTFPTWTSWNEPWNSGSSTLMQPQVIGGNQQGFILFRDEGTNEGSSLYIQSISGNTITSPDHCLNNGDYIVINGCLGTIPNINGQIFSVANATRNTFTVNPTLSSGTYSGGGVITRMYVPFVQTKEFPTAWGMSRKTRLGPQMYLFSTTELGQIQLQIFLSQQASNTGYNLGPIIPSPNSENNSLIYSTTLFTCPESTNLGLTPGNVNLNMVTSNNQQQTWHRLNTSLIGDTVQLGFTLSDQQMRDPDFNSQFSEIELHGFILDVSPSQLLA